jgi:hypothetical protein
MNVEHLEADLIELSKKYAIPHMVVLFRDEDDMKIRTVIDSKGSMYDLIVGSALGEFVEKMVQDHRDDIFKLAEQKAREMDR